MALINFKQLKKAVRTVLNGVVEQQIKDLIALRSITADLLFANDGQALTEEELSYLKGVTSAIQTQLDKRWLTADVKKSTDSIDWLSDAITVTAKAIADKIDTTVGASLPSGAMVFKGGWSEVGNTIPLATIKAGWNFFYDSGTEPAGHELEIGDMVVARRDNPSLSNAAHWFVVQANIVGAVVCPETITADGQMVVFSGTSGKIIKKLELGGLLAADDNGVLRAATGEDLPEHDHHYSGFYKTNVSFMEACDGVRKIFNLPGVDVVYYGSEQVFLNGVALVRGTDYNISTSGQTITLLSSQYAPDATEVLLINYWVKKNNILE